MRYSAGLSGISHALDKRANGNDVTVFEKNAEVEEFYNPKT